jgi:hypothetical protein
MGYSDEGAQWKDGKSRPGTAIRSRVQHPLICKESILVISRMTEEPEMDMPVLVEVGMDCLRAIRAGEKYLDFMERPIGIQPTPEPWQG